MTSYANEALPEVKTPPCHTSVQERLSRRTNVQHGDHTQNSLVVSAYLIPVVQFLGGHFLYANEDNSGS